MQSNSLSWNSPDDRALIKKALMHDELVLGTTDTVLGLFANVTKEGFERLNVVKKRYEKPYIILIASQEKVSSFAEVKSESVRRIMTLGWPGPVTLILNKNTQCPDFFSYGKGTVALRVPDHQGLLMLLKSFQGLFSTSANISGKQVPTTIEYVDPDIVKQVRYYIDTNSSYSAPSTILDCTGKQINVVRSGAYEIEKLEHIAGVSFSK